MIDTTGGSLFSLLFEADHTREMPLRSTLPDSSERICLLSLGDALLSVIICH